MFASKSANIEAVQGQRARDIGHGWRHYIALDWQKSRGMCEHKVQYLDIYVTRLSEHRMVQHSNTIVPVVRHSHADLWGDQSYTTPRCGSSHYSQCIGRNTLWPAVIEHVPPRASARRWLSSSGL